MTRVLILCTHNSARSQMAEALTRDAARRLGVHLEVHSAGTEATRVKAEARTVMAELGLSLDTHTSKALYDVPDPWNFDHVVTVCDSAAEACPAYPGTTIRRHYPFTDPSGGSLERWRMVRDQLRTQFEAFVQSLKDGQAAPASYDESLPRRPPERRRDRPPARGHSAGTADPGCGAEREARHLRPRGLDSERAEAEGSRRQCRPRHQISDSRTTAL